MRRASSSLRNVAYLLDRLRTQSDEIDGSAPPHDSPSRPDRTNVFIHSTPCSFFPPYSFDCVSLICFVSRNSCCRFYGNGDDRRQRRSADRLQARRVRSLSARVFVVCASLTRFLLINCVRPARQRRPSRARSITCNPYIYIYNLCK
jgi:hypothetical protein